MSNIVFSEIGWDQGFAFPVANAENKALEDELQVKQKDRERLKSEISEHKDSIQAMTHYLKNIKQELSHTQALCAALEKEAESEMHLKAVADREVGHLQQEITKLEKEMETLNKKKEALESDIPKATQKMEKLMSQMNFDHQTLEAWLEESRKKDEDTIAVLKYVHQDKSKIKELIHAIDKTTVKAHQKHKALENEHTKTVSAQIGLDKTVESLRKAHTERQVLIRQWEATVEQMRKRDHDLQQCIMMIPEMNKEVRQRQETLKERKLGLERQVGNNTQCESKGLSMRRRAVKLREEFQKRDSNRARVQDEFDSLRVTVESVATDIETKRSQLASIKKDIEVKQSKLADIELRNTALEEKLQTVTETVLSVDERATQMEQILKEEGQNKKEMEAHVVRLQMAKPTVTQELQGLRAQEKALVNDIAASRVALNTLINQRDRAEHRLMKLLEMINSKDFQIQLLQRKVVCVQVEENSLQRQILRKEELKLVKGLEEEKKISHMLSHHLNKLQTELSIVRKLHEKNEEEKRELTEKIGELNLINDTCNKELNKIRAIKQDTMVEDNMLKLEMHRLSAILQNKADKVLSLEKQQTQMLAAMKEREAEIHVHKEVLLKQFKMADRERQKLSVEMNEKVCKIDKLRKRYEIMILSMEAPEGDGWNPEYYLVKIDKEKEELQRIGNDLDAKIFKKEEEIQALENTLQGIYIRNVEYRRAFHNIAKWSKEHQQQLKLEKERKIMEEKGAQKRRHAKELQEDIQGMRGTLKSLLTEEMEQLAGTERDKVQIEALKKDLGTQKIKLDRVSKQYSKLTKEIRANQSTDDKTVEEEDIEVRGLKDFSRMVDSMLYEAMKDNPGLRSALETQFQEANVSLPALMAPASSMQTSRNSAARSSLSIRSSVSSSGSGLRSSAMQFPYLKKVDLGLQLTVTPQNDSCTSPSGSKQDGSCSSSYSISQP